MSKIFRWTGYVSAAIGFVLIIMGVVGHICHRFCNAAACAAATSSPVIFLHVRAQVDATLAARNCRLPISVLIRLMA